MSKITINNGYRYLFTYPNFGTPDGHPDYTAHSGQVVEVVRQLNDQECDKECQPSYYVKAADGWVGNVHASELSECDQTFPSKAEDFEDNCGPVTPEIHPRPEKLVCIEDAECYAMCYTSERLAGPISELLNLGMQALAEKRRNATLNEN